MSPPSKPSPKAPKPPKPPKPPPGALVIVNGQFQVQH